MENPFELILNKLSSIEELLNELKNGKGNNEKQKETYPEFLNISQASEFLHIAKQTVYGLTSSRSIPHYKTGKRVYFKKMELDEWIIKHRIKTKDEIESDASQWLLTRRNHKNGRKNK